MTETKRSPEEPAATALRRRSFLASAALAATAPVAASTVAHASERSAPGRLPTPDRGPAERLLAVPLKNRRDDWLQEALQIAVAVEFSTIPPYLCAWWSINDRKSEVAQLIRRVVLDEMFHLGVVCNLLVAVGGRPDIHAAAPSTPARCRAECTPGSTSTSRD